MAATQVRGSTQIMAGSIYDAQIAATAAIASSKLADGANWIKKDGTVAMTGALNMGSQLINNVATPVSANDATNKSYVDNLVGNGLVVKQAVMYTTTANINLTGLTTQAGGDWATTLTAGMRILVKNQTTGSANGIYIASATAWARAADFIDAVTVLPNSYMFVEMGTTLSDTGWVLTTDPPFTVGTTALSFQQFSSAGAYTQGNGITIAGSVISANLGNGLQFSGSQTTLKLADGTLTVDASGLRISALTSAYVLVGNGSNVATGIPLSGDVSITNTGVTTVSSAFLKLANFIYGEVPTGSVNGVNTTFTLANTPSSATVQVHQNGIRLNVGAGNDYTVSGGTITMLTAPLTGDVILVDYMK
jgi:hypothetical protein